MHILIDGYNLIRQSVTFRQLERRGLEAGRNALLERLAVYKKKTGHKMTVIFDAWESGFLTEERDRHGEINIIYSRKGETADDLIKRIIEHRKESLAVVTSDRVIADFATRRGVAAIASPVFESRLQQQIVTALDNRDETLPAFEDDDESKNGFPSTKKGPSHRLSKKRKVLESVIKKL